MSKIVFTDDDPVGSVLDAAPEMYFINTQQSEVKAGDAFEVLEGRVTALELSAPTGSYTHTQSSASSTWVINHNLGKPIEPTVLLDSAPTVAVITDVLHGTINQTTLVFGSPVTGKAYF